MPTSLLNSTRRNRLSGENSLGLRTMVHPVASAEPSFHTAIISGKFHGTIPATTPKGSRRVKAVYCSPAIEDRDGVMLSPLILVVQPAK
ncbi:hypothetical protein D3C77_501050 [compost metagenome]